MQRYWFTALISIIFFVFSLSPALAQEVKGPDLFIENGVHDFQTVKEGQVLDHTFRVVNKGDQNLEIEKVQPDWGCTVTEFDKVILPGGEGKIRLQVKTEGYQGNITRGAKVYTNDPAEKTTSITLKAFVQPWISISSSYVSLYGQEGDRIVKMVDVSAGIERPLSLTPARFNLGEKVNYRVEEVEKGKIFRIHFENRPEVVGTFYGILELKTGYPEKPLITFRIRGRFDPKGKEITNKNEKQEEKQ